MASYEVEFFVDVVSAMVCVVVKQLDTFINLSVTLRDWFAHLNSTSFSHLLLSLLDDLF